MKPAVYRLLILLIVLNPFRVSAQVLPPTLKLGINAVTGQKGNLDVELIASLVEEKQEEIKKEFIKRNIFEKLKQENYTAFEFSYNTLTTLTSAKDKKAIQRKLLESSANLALVYGFSEAYAHASIKLDNSDLFEWMEKYAQRVNPADRNMIQTMDSMNRLPTGNLFALQTLSTNETAGSTYVSISSILVDMVYDLLAKKKIFEKLGFMDGVNTIDIKFYQENSAYIKYYNSITDNDEKAEVDSLYERMSNEADLLGSNFYAIKLLAESGSNLKSALLQTLKDVVFPLLKDSSGRSIQMSFPDSVFVDSVLAHKDLIRNTVRDTLNALLDSLAEFVNNYATPTPTFDASRKQDSLERNEINKVLKYLRHSDIKKFNSLDLYFFNERVIPLLNKILLENGTGKNARVIAGQIEQLVEGLVFFTMTDSIMSNDFISDLMLLIPANSYGDFVSLIISMSDLAKAPTYSKIVSIITESKNLLPPGNAQQMMGKLTKLIERYTQISEDSNIVVINVEEILLQLYDRFANRSKSMIDFYMSVGLNQTSNISYKPGYELYESDTSGNATTEVLKSIGFASEKIGIKLKLWDFKYKQSFGYGEYSGDKMNLVKDERRKKYKSREPLISDIHAIIYGSGILYNIANTKTNKNFDYVLLGTSLGFSFYNGLDLNLFYNVPLVTGENFDQSWNRRKMYGIAFDIKFGEYIQAYRKKMAEKQKVNAEEKVD